MNKKNKPLFLVLVSLEDSKSQATKSGQESPSALTSYPSIEVPQTLVKTSKWFRKVEADSGEECVPSTLCWGEQAVCDDLFCGWLPPTMKYVKVAHSCHSGASWI